MEPSQKAAGLLAAAEAFLARGASIQYDQLSMDRLLRVTPRHSRCASPEEATAQHRLFLDCARFVHSVYFTAFGQELEADVTWNMLELVKPRVYDCCPTHRETLGDRARIREEVLSLLRPGDALVMRFPSSGHIVLCGEGGFFYHCTEKGGKKSYRYEERRDSFSPSGAIYKDLLDELFVPGARYDLLGKDVLRFSVLRPLERMGALTPGTLARLGEARDLSICVLSSHPGGQAACPGERVTYTVQVHNRGTDSRTAHIQLTPGEGICLIGAGQTELRLEPGQTGQAEFWIRLPLSHAAFVPPPAVTVNGLPVWAERVLLCASPPEEGEQLAAQAQAAVLSGQEALAAVSEAGRPLGIPLPSSEAELLAGYFLRYDSALGDVLWRRPQDPGRDGCLYSFFGGTGVITPEAGSDAYIRTRHITASSLRPGDLVLCSDDPLFLQTCSCLVTQKGLAGRFAPGGPSLLLSGRNLDQFLDSLPGRFCYVAVRPGGMRRTHQ